MSSSSSSSTTSPPARRKSSVLFRIFLYGGLIMALAAMIFFKVVDRRGAKLWAETRAELETRGESLAVEPFLPKPVPPGQNFFRDPLVGTWFLRHNRNQRALDLMPQHPRGCTSIPMSTAELKDPVAFKAAMRGTNDVITLAAGVTPSAAMLEWYKRYDEGLQAVHQAAERPYAVFEVDYRRPWEEQRIPNYVRVRTLVQALSTHAKASFLAGHPDEAIRDLTAIQRLGEGLNQGLPLVSAMIGVAICGLYVDVAGEGLAEGAWKEPQLRAIQAHCRRFDLPGAVQRSLRAGERNRVVAMVEGVPGVFASDVATIRSLEWYERVFALMPIGWADENLANYCRLLQPAIEGYDPKAGRVDAQKLAAASKLTEGIGVGDRSGPTFYLASIAIPNFLKAFMITAKNQSLLNLLDTACGLELYRAAHGRYPEQLPQLVPQYLPAVPKELISTQPIRYRLEGNAGYKLYSAGWDGVDHGGKPSTERADEGDWVLPGSAGPSR